MSKDSKKEKKALDACEKKIESLEQQLKEITKEKDELLEKLQRVSADYTNFQRRVPKQVADSVNYEKKAIIKSLLPSLDNFELALKSDHSAEDVDAVIKGVKLVFEHMLDSLNTHGVTKIEAVNQPFDPAQHEAVMQKQDESKENNIVLEEFQTGYRLNDQILRPSKVIVNKVPVEEPKAQTSDDDQSPENSDMNEETESKTDQE